MFFLSRVSIVIVCSEYPMMVPSGMIFKFGAGVCRGSFVFRAKEFSATFLRVFMSFIVFSPDVKKISDRYIFVENLGSWRPVLGACF